MVTVSLYGSIVEVDINRFITIDDVIRIINQYIEDSQALPTRQLLLINATNCRTDIGLKDLSKLDAVNDMLSKKFDLLKVAVLLNDPVYTAICMIYNRLIKSDHYYIKVFTTRAAAQRWLIR